MLNPTHEGYYHPPAPRTLVERTHSGDPNTFNSRQQLNVTPKAWLHVKGSPYGNLAALCRTG